MPAAQHLEFLFEEQSMETFLKGLLPAPPNEHDSPLGVREGAWQVVNRIAIEELQAWHFGDWEAARQANPYPRAQPMS